MLGWWFNAKVLRVLRDDVNYDPAVPGIQAPVFNQTCKIARQIGGNEYDAAIMFLCTQLSIVRTSGGDKLPSTVDFVRNIEEIMTHTLAPQAKDGLGHLSVYYDELRRIGEQAS